MDDKSQMNVMYHTSQKWRTRGTDSWRGEPPGDGPRQALAEPPRCRAVSSFAISISTSPMPGGSVPCPGLAKGPCDAGLTHSSSSLSEH